MLRRWLFLKTCREQWEERAAIIEWDGHMPRAAAERLAWAMLPHQLQEE